MKIITAVVNNPIFIEIQFHTLKKYFQGEYEFIVFNDAKDFPDFTNNNDITIKTKIQNVCSKLNIQCINIPNNHHKINKVASVRTADSMNFILKYQLENPDKYLLLDSDMFLVNHFDINKYSHYDCAVVLQNRMVNNTQINYFWNGIYYFDMTKMKNTELLNWNCYIGTDTGWMMQKWLSQQMNNNADIYFIKHLSSGTWDINELPADLQNHTQLITFFKNDPRNKNNRFFSELYDDVFLHYRAGGNWNHEGLHLHYKLSQFLQHCLL
jgi:hypothetical protein